MNIRKRIGRAVLACGLAVTVVVGVGTSASAQTDAPSIYSRNASDPWIYPCYTSSFAGWCAYTSNDLNSGGQNQYPMNKTFVYTWDGTGNPADPAEWTDRSNNGASPALQESNYPWVTAGTNHMWAPNAAYGPGFDMYLYVPSTENGSNIYSHVGVSTSASPWGPFTYQKQITFNGNNITNLYMSDPFVFQSMGDHPGYPVASRLDGPARWLFWANGNFDTSGIACGGISGALLDDANMSEIYDNDNNLSNNEISITGMSGMANCGGKGRPYLEGPDVYFTRVWGFEFGTGTPQDPFRPYMMVLSAKPTNTNQVIAYASAEKPLGPYRYEGTMLDASGSSWTTQASIAMDQGGPSGATRFLLIYHDDTSGTNHNRKTFITCLTFDLSDKKFLSATRPSSQPNLNNCNGIRP